MNIPNHPTLDEVVEALVPQVPSKEFALCFKRSYFLHLHGGSGQAMEDWGIGKDLQCKGYDVDYHFEAEQAAGFYHRVLRPVLVRAIKEQIIKVVGQNP